MASLAELDARRLYRDAGCSSLFTYCTQRLHLSEHAAYRRIEAARVARRFPLILQRLSEGAVTLTAVGLVAEHLTSENHVALLDQIRHQCKRAVESIVAAWPHDRTYDRRFDVCRRRSPRSRRSWRHRKSSG